MAAGAPGGLSTRVGERAWRELVEHVAETLDIGPGTRVFDVGCGAGALLYPLYENGYIVGGLEPSSDLIAIASDAMPESRFVRGSVNELDPADAWQAVISAVFAQFPDFHPGWDFSRGVIARMAAKATHGIALVAMPEDRFDRRWILHALAEVGASAIQVEELKLEGFADSAKHFNVFARV